MTKLPEKIKQLIKYIGDIRLPPPVKDLILGISVGTIIILISAFGFFQKFEYIALDSMFRLIGQFCSVRWSG